MAKTLTPKSCTRLAATSSWVLRGLEAMRTTSAPPAWRVRARLAVSAVTCRQADMRRPARGLSRPKRSRMRASTGMSPSAHRMRFLPAGARRRSLTSHRGWVATLMLTPSSSGENGPCPWPGPRGPVADALSAVTDPLVVSAGGRRSTEQLYHAARSLTRRCRQVQITNRLLCFWDRPMRALKQPRALQTRERILGAAARLFALKGYHDTKLEEVLRAARVTTGAFFHHFAGKEDLGFAVIDRHMEKRRRQLEQIEQGLPPADGEDPLQPVFRRLDAIGEMVRRRRRKGAASLATSARRSATRTP